MKKYIVFIALGLFVALLGCGGGGGGGGGNGSTNSTTGFTSGQTDASASSTIIGQVVSQLDNSPIAGVTVRFLTSANAVVATATSRANGYFDADVPVSAVKMEADSSTTPAGFYNAFKYNGAWYYPNLTCRASLPAITPGVLTPLLGRFFYLPPNSIPPPPPPGGCQP